MNGKTNGNAKHKPSLIPGFTDTAILRLRSGAHHTAEEGTIGINRNSKNPANLTFGIPPDIAEQVGFTDGDKVSIHFKGMTFIIVKGGHRMLKKDGVQLRCNTAPLYLIDERVRVKAEVVPADLSDKDNPVPAYVKFTLPTTARKNPKYFADATQDEPLDTSGLSTEDADYDDEK